MVRATFSGEYVGVSKGRLMLMLAAAGYLVSPLDLIPEAVLPIVGLADDALVLSWLATRLVEETEAFLEWEKGIVGAPAGRPAPAARWCRVHRGAGGARCGRCAAAVERVDPAGRGADRARRRRALSPADAADRLTSVRRGPSSTGVRRRTPSSTGPGESWCGRLRTPATVVGMTADITLRGPGDVVAILPYQLGYHPRDSVVVISLRGRRVGLVARSRPPARRPRRRGRGHPDGPAGP